MRLALLAPVSLALAACSYVKPMPKPLTRALAGADTLYVLPVTVDYHEKGLFVRRGDSAAARRIGEDVSLLLEQELQQAFPRAALKRVQDSSAVPDRAGFLVRCEVEAFRRTWPREVASDAFDILFMVPTFMTSVAFPVHPTSQIRLEIRKGKRGLPTRLKHRDDVEPSDLEDLRFQLRILLNPGSRGGPPTVRRGDGTLGEPCWRA